MSLVVFVGSHVATAQQAPTPQQLAEFREDLLASFVSNQGGVGTSGGGPAMLRTLVRLSFHDCASAQCDGCIDTLDTRNNPGLEEMIAVLQPICNKFSLGKADCWAAAGSMAVELTSFNGPDLARVPLFFGREDAPSCTGFTKQNPEAVFPSASVGYVPTVAYFQDNFNFTVNETVAILGAHSLGLASPKGSGFDGAWTIAPNTLDNTFFSDMAKGQLGWEPQLLPPPVSLYQWTSVTGQQLMLNSDMCLLLDIFNETSGGTSPKPGVGLGGVAPGTATQPLCTYDACDDSPTAAMVRTYAADNTRFMADFTAVWIKMVLKGYDVCEVSAVPSAPVEGGLEELYGIDALTADCPPVVPEFSGPVTTGVFGGVEAPVAGGGDNGMMAPVKGPAAGPEGGPAEAPLVEEAAAPEDAMIMTEEAMALDQPEVAVGEEVSAATCRRAAAAAVAVGVLAGLVG
eukprot:jgi/Ulvmu1/222/UM001_0226.1